MTCSSATGSLMHDLGSDWAILKHLSSSYEAIVLLTRIGALALYHAGV